MLPSLECRTKAHKMVIFFSNEHPTGGNQRGLRVVYSTDLGKKILSTT